MENGTCFGCDKTFGLKELEKHYSICYQETLDEHKDYGKDIYLLKIETTKKKEQSDDWTIDKDFHYWVHICVNKNIL